MKKVILYRAELNGNYGRDKVVMIYVENSDGGFDLLKVYTDYDYYKEPDVIKIAKVLNNYGGYYNEIEQDYYKDEEGDVIMEYKILFSHRDRRPIYCDGKYYEDEEAYTIAVWKTNDVEVIYE